jgi:hypothetical protein
VQVHADLFDIRKCIAECAGRRTAAKQLLAALFEEGPGSAGYKAHGRSLLRNQSWLAHAPRQVEPAHAGKNTIGDRPMTIAVFIGFRQDLSSTGRSNQ